MTLPTTHKRRARCAHAVRGGFTRALYQPLVQKDIFPRVRLIPSLRASHLNWAGLALVVLGLLRISATAVACGCALMFGVALSRAITSVSVARARAAGFEMLWLTSQASVQAIRQRSIVIRAELRNRDTLATHFKNLTVSHSPGLVISVVPQQGSIPPGGKLTIELHVVPKRVGYHGIHSLTLCTIIAPGLFTVPLAFSNPFVVDVGAEPGPLNVTFAGRGQNHARSQHAVLGPRRGEALELKELREHQAGDPYRRIAWKASARRGKLMVIDREAETHEAAWILLDLSTDSASGDLGDTALDRAVDCAQRLISVHQKRGDALGLALFGTRLLTAFGPERSTHHYAKLRHALVHGAHTADEDRSDWDDADVAQKVLEHARGLDRDCAALTVHDYDLLVERARSILKRAPVRATQAWATHETGQLLRNYLLSFGIQPPPRTASDRFQTELQMARFIFELCHKRKTCSVVSVLGRPPTLDTPKQLLDAFRWSRRRHIGIHFYPMLDLSLPKDQQKRAATNLSSLKSRVATDALFHRQRLATEDGIVELNKLGVRVHSNLSPRLPRIGLGLTT